MSRFSFGQKFIEVPRGDARALCFDVVSPHASQRAFNDCSAILNLLKSRCSSASLFSSSSSSSVGDGHRLHMKHYHASTLVASCLLLFLSASNLSGVRGRGVTPEDSSKPWFPEPVANVTVAEGRPATLTCVVENLKHHRLVWIHQEKHVLLNLEDQIITMNPRISIRTDTPRKTWWLKIDDVHIDDAGRYMCQVNSDPMISEIGYLHVVVPPSIDEEWTSSDIEVREGSDTKLQCRATGSPQPEILWRREHDRKINPTPREMVSTVNGNLLHLKKTTRLSMGAYLCIASNGVQPSVSKRIMLNILFPPIVLMHAQLIGASIGEDVSLLCNLESNPRSITYWLLTEGNLIINNSKYHIYHHTDPSPKAFSYKIQLELKILNLRPQDFRSYTCVAKNSLGESQGMISLYEKPNPYPKPPSKDKHNEGNENNSIHNPKQKLEDRHVVEKQDLLHKEDTDNKSSDGQSMLVSAVTGIKGNWVASEESESDALNIKPVYSTFVASVVSWVILCNGSEI